MARMSLIAALFLTASSGTVQAQVLDLSSWLEKPKDYKRGYVLGWAEGMTTGLTTDNDEGREWRSALRTCLRGMTDQQLVYEVERYLLENIFFPDDVSRMNEPIADHVSPALVQLCAGQLPN